MKHYRINRMSLLNSLLSMVNEGCEEDSGYVLAHYFLEHYSRLSSLNIYDVAADCFVSRSSVRRFCRLLGYENFLDLKTDFGEYDSLSGRFIGHADRGNYRECLTREIDGMIREMDARMNNEETERIVDRIHDSRYVVFLASDTSASLVKRFQQSMIFCSRIVYLISNDYDNRTLISRLNERDYLFTLSASGNFAFAALDYLQGCGAYKALVTVNRDPVFGEHYDKVYHLSAQDHGQEAFSVYGTYGISYMLDIIFSRFVRKYGLTGKGGSGKC